jgi:predicted nucleic acid-binding Zn ribbon protein
MKRKNNYKVDEAVMAFMEDSGIKDQYLMQSVMGAWAEVVGDAIANNTDEIWYEQQVLNIKMKSATWRQEVLMQRTQIKNKIQAWLGEELPKDIRVL